MSTGDWKARLKELYLPPTKDFVFVDVPDLQFVMIDGEGDPTASRTGRPCVALLGDLSAQAHRQGADGQGLRPNRRSKGCGGPTT